MSLVLRRVITNRLRRRCLLLADPTSGWVMRSGYAVRERFTQALHHRQGAPYG
jgi:hypothetical protein